MEEIVQKTADYIKKYFKNDTSGHDWWHTYRVWQTAKKLARKEDADLFIVEMAALLHDLDDFKFGGGNKVENWLDQFEIKPEDKARISDAAHSVSFKGAKVDTKPKTIEGQVVQDADRLDAIGAIGLARVFAFGGSHGKPIYTPGEKAILHCDFNDYKKSNSSNITHFYEKLLLLKDLMNTKSARKVATKRHQILEDFLLEFFKEWDGKDI